MERMKENILTLKSYPFSTAMVTRQKAMDKTIDMIQANPDLAGSMAPMKVQRSGWRMPLIARI
ncbi:D-ribose-binding periplasmic protein [Escherichia coli]|uniref:D-ribose-binding periplasmic protein n=1 Tax=Escherichia coli TaxID=562 RepID=A0A376NU15_ECOLX|nr:D-ribose-binding periplasmic protein [Escherichia coli]